ncbi:acyltransferase family protein [Citricoccus sp. K5]|uniref:acyltransferase family protein n=1 Tax=Citricoccus sp. K5 TaxID=2653135 RepID=UPI0012F1907C|nr:acyltransferase [Citricoccus sp. K5]VXB07278.1 Fucose 4-O-acetylase-like acetyltransferase [Citricoccus sp. K5]
MDVLRIVSIVAVVAGHSYGPRLVGSEYLEIWRMPLFFFLTGYFWTRGRPFVYELQARSRTLAVPYLIWAVIMSVAAWAWTRDTPEEFWPLMANGWYGGSDQTPPWWAFWFISVLFFVTLLRRILERFPVLVAWGVAVLGLALSMLPDSLLGRTPFGLGLALPCLFFVLAGELFRYELQPRIKRNRALIGAVLIAAGLLAVTLGVEPLNIKFSGFGQFLITPVVGAMTAAGFVLVFSTVVNRLVTGAARPVNALVRTGTVVVLFHGWLLQTLVDLGILDDGAKFALTVLISWAVGLAINATPLSPWLSGVPAPDWWVQWRARRRERAATTHL